MFTKTIGLACIAAFTSAMQIEASLWNNINNFNDNGIIPVQWEDKMVYAEVDASIPPPDMWDVISAEAQGLAQVAAPIGGPSDEQKAVLFELYNWAKAGRNDGKTDRMQFWNFQMLMKEYGVTAKPQKTGCDVAKCGATTCKKGADVQGGFC